MDTEMDIRDGEGPYVCGGLAREPPKQITRHFPPDFFTFLSHLAV